MIREETYKTMKNLIRLYGLEVSKDYKRVLCRREGNEDHDLFIKSEFGKLSIGSNNRKDLSNVVCDDIQNNLQQLYAVQQGVSNFFRRHSERMRQVEATDMSPTKKAVSLLTEGYSNYIKNVMSQKNSIIKRMN